MGLRSEDTQTQTKGTAENTTIEVEAPRPFLITENPESREVEQQPLAIIPAEAPEASDDHWCVFLTYEVGVG